MGKKLTLKKSLGGSPETTLSAAPGITHLDKKIGFSLRYCDTGNFCIRNLDRNKICQLYARLGYFEDIDWKTVAQISHQRGFNIEKKGQPNHSRLVTLFPQFSTFLHFQVGGDLIRVFAAQRNSLCYILQIDSTGSFNH